MFLGLDLKFLWAPLWSHFPWSFFSPLLPSSLFLLPPLFHGLTHELCKHWGFVCSCCGQSVALTGHQFMYGLQWFSGLPLWFDLKRQEGGKKRQRHGDWCCLRFMYPSDARGRMLWPQVLFCLHFPVVCVMVATWEPCTSYWNGSSSFNGLKSK